MLSWFKGLHFVPLAQIANSFLFFGCTPKKEKAPWFYPRRSASKALFIFPLLAVY